MTGVHAVQQVAVDLVAERSSLKHEASVEAACILYTVFSERCRVNNAADYDRKESGVKRFLAAMITILLSAATVQAQSEAALKEYFEGRTVALKLPMPGTEKGVDIYPGNPRPL